MSRRHEPKQTKHHYRGYDILGTYYETESRRMLGGRYWSEGGAKRRNYNIQKDGNYVLNPWVIIDKLKYAKEVVDELIEENEK
ncbi:MAG: hypothetical protein WD512_07760 [Candidatus Paceibacterota bacterium]